MNNFKKLLAVSGNSVATSTAEPWGYMHGYQGLGMLNSKITINGDDLVCFGGYNGGAASIKKDGSAVNWSKQYTGPVLTHSSRGSDTPSYDDLDTFQRPLVLSSTKTIFPQEGLWLYLSPFLALYYKGYKFINTGTGSVTSDRIIPQETSYDSASSGIYVDSHTFCRDSSGNYILCFESSNEAYMEGYNSSDVLQWTKKTSSKGDLLKPLVENIGTDTLVPCVEAGEMRFAYVNITTGAVSNFNGKRLSGYQSTGTYNIGTERLGYDSSGNISLMQKSVEEFDSNTVGSRQQVWIRMSSGQYGSVVSAYGISYILSSQESFAACMDSSDNLYFMARDDDESNATTPEYGPKIIKLASDGTTVWERVITSSYTGTSICTIYDINVSGNDDLFYVTCRLRHSNPLGYDTFILALPTDGTSTTFSGGGKTYYFKPLTDGNSRFAITSYSHTVSTDTGTATWSTATSPGNYTTAIGASSDSDLTQSYTDLTVS
tara:strand:+ start:1707 stop:3173 length:1467 start_codon:yes stop_codon:yes gene_type:complete